MECIKKYPCPIFKVNNNGMFNKNMIKRYENYLIDDHIYNYVLDFYLTKYNIDLKKLNFDSKIDYELGNDNQYIQLYDVIKANIYYTLTFLNKRFMDLSPKLLISGNYKNIIHKYNYPYCKKTMWEFIKMNEDTNIE